MTRIFVDTERIRDLNSGLGQTCLRVGQELVRQQPADADLTFLVPKGQIGVFGEPGARLHYQEATWLRKLWNPGYYDVWHNLHQDAAYWPSQRPGKLVLTINDLNFLERPDYSEAKKARKLAAVQQRVNRTQVITTLSDYTGSVVYEHLTLPETTTLQTVYIGVSTLPTPPVAPPKVISALKTPFFSISRRAAPQEKRPYVAGHRASLPRLHVGTGWP